jgi:hypothetical protein
MMSVPDEQGNDVFPANILPPDKARPAVTPSRRTKRSWSNQRRSRQERVAFSGRLGAALGPAPHLSAIRHVLHEAATAGFEPKLLYQQAVLARPSDWPSAPPYEQVMQSDDLVMKPTQHRSAITRDQATRIAGEHLGRLPNFVGAKVGKVVAWDEIDWRRPSIFNAPRGIPSSEWLLVMTRNCPVRAKRAGHSTAHRLFTVIFDRLVSSGCTVKSDRHH